MNHNPLHLSVQDLAATPGLKSLPDATLLDLLECSASHRLKAGQILFKAGDEYHERVYLMAGGILCVERTGGRMERPPVGYLVGLSGYFSRGAYAVTAVALNDVRLGVIEHADLEALERRHGELADAFNRLIGRTLRQRRSRNIQDNGLLNQHASQLMSSPVLTCPATTTTREAVHMMDQHGHGSLVIEASDGDHHQVTYKSLARHLTEQPVDAANDPVTAAQQELPAVEANEPIWRVQDLQMHSGAKHVLVTQAGKPAGIISQTDLAHLLSSPQLQLAAKIRGCRNFKELRGCYEDMAEFAAANLESHRYAHEAVQSLSAAHLSVQQRCIDLTLAQMRDEGLGPPPAPYALIIMGSGGRREMLLDPDQDNGLILSDEAADNLQARSWFKQFCARANSNLDACGYILCPGNIMANNPNYHKTFSEWEHQIRHIAQRPNEKAARWSNITFDFNTLYGDADLTRALRNSSFETLHERPRLLQFMVDDDAQGRAPIGWFNRLLTHEDQGGREIVDIKRNGLRIVVNAARILSLHSRIASCHTHDRISALVRCGVLSQDHGATILEAYDELLEILLNHQIRQRRAGQAPDKYVAPHELLQPERESLRVAMRAVQRFQEKLQDTIGHAGQ